MKISEMIKQLTSLKEEHGDIEVWTIDGGYWSHLQLSLREDPPLGEDSPNKVVQAV